MVEQKKSQASLVPHFIFSDIASEQEKQLSENALIQRFRISREKFSTDRYRPHYHYVSPENNLNDPNGLCFWHGKWHLFYQGFPPEDPRPHWGHAVSEDLIHWRDLPYAIYPDPEENCFSGGTLVENGRVIAMYQGVGRGIMIATSHDPLLLNWEKLTGDAVIPKPKEGEPALPYDIGDPFLWKEGAFYYALSGGGLPHVNNGKKTRAEFLFCSQDLVNWKYLHPFLEGDAFGQIDDDGSCPYFLPLGEQYILLLFSHRTGGKYILGDYDKVRNKFKVTNGGNFNFGAVYPGGVHAPSAYPDGKGGIITMFNINQSKDTLGWNHIMSLPLRLTLASRDKLGMEPAGDINSLRAEHKTVELKTLPVNQEIVFSEIQGDCMELELEFVPNDASMVELNVLRSPDKEEYTRISFYPHRGCHSWERFTGWDMKPWRDACDSIMMLDSSYSSTLDDVLCRAPEIVPVYISPDEPVKMRVFIDRSVLEVFVNGRQYAAIRVFPGRGDSLGVSMRSCGKDTQLNQFNAWQMKNIYE